MKNYRIFVEKHPQFRVEAQSLQQELNSNLGLELKNLRLLNVYDLFGFTPDVLEKSRYSVFGEIVTDNVENSCSMAGKKYLAVEFLPGQFDQRASSAVDCVKLIEPSADVHIKSSRLLIFDDNLSDTDAEKIRNYYINKIESREKNLSILDHTEHAEITPVPVLNGFSVMTENDLETYCKTHELAMNADDLHEVVKYFKAEGRDPFETELRILDTYWSDHCRHTTFMTELEDITIDDSFMKNELQDSLNLYHEMRKDLNREDKSICLMDVATIGARYLRKKGLLDDLEVSEENNACSIFIDVDVDGEPEKWLLMFKNETHNHPTEIEPFGGASTCLGGAIRDPLSGRSYVYQAMRVTGASDIYKPIRETMEGKLPQRIISTKAAAGYSSYGNQIGIPTTHLREIYHPDYVAKRMEIGAVVGAVKAEHVRRETPKKGDIILLLGGRTGRDGIGGATGSSKEQNVNSIEECSSEVQKGNAPEERKLLRLFRRPEVTKHIKKSNDFGAGGVSVAIGELTNGLDIYLDRIPLKYKGLNSTEIAISESQERMAVVIDPSSKSKFETYCAEENVEVTHVADVIDNNRMRMYNNGKLVVDLAREFIDSAGAKHFAKATIGKVEEKNPFKRNIEGATLEEKMLNNLSDDNVLSQKGLIELFDSTVGRGTVLMPFGGKTQRTETQVSVQKIPVQKGYTDTASIMAFGFNPFISEWSPYHGAAYAVVEACAKVVAAGASYENMRFSYQEYFERMTDDPRTWGKPLSALLGALKMQNELGLPSIGGKDSMSGTFKDINVPPTLVAFGITTVDAGKIISPEFKKAGNSIYLIKHTPLENYMPDTEQLKKNWSFVTENIHNGNIVSAYSIGFGGVGEALAKMSFGNNMGVSIWEQANLFDYSYGSILVEINGKLEFENAHIFGTTTECEYFDTNTIIQDEEIVDYLESKEKLYKANTEKFATVYPDVSKEMSRLRSASLDMTTLRNGENGENDLATSSPNHSPFFISRDTVIPSEAHEVCEVEESPCYKGTTAGADVHVCAKIEARITNPRQRVEKPIAYLPVFPGMNSDYDVAKAFERAGAEVVSTVFCNLNSEDISRSIEQMKTNISKCHIFAISGGFSAGDEPDGSGKFIASVLNNKIIADEIHKLIERGGLILGICNGFQALVKSGLLPYGKLGMVTKESPTLFKNDINRHISQIAKTRVSSLNSPWLTGFTLGEEHAIAVSHGEGKFVVSEKLAQELFANGQVAFQYVDPEGNITVESPYNPNGSQYAIEGIISQNGQILGKMGHSERYENNLFKNIDGNKVQDIFANAVRYFKKS
ncbi:MAG: phosphoribosylformylglycinamidine synthase [Bacteroidales bacterium]|nr:phosphoribosylformylglycinamidine synthase [Bacteroidales bacterium]